MGRRRSRYPLDKQALSRLTGERLLLRQPGLADALPVYHYATDPRASHFLAWAPHREAGETRQFLCGCIEGWHETQEKGRLAWVIEVDAQVVGMIEAKLKGRNAGIGYVLAPEAWGRGYATEALGLVSEALFRHSPVSAIWALCVVENPASARVLEKSGFQRETLLANYFPCPNLAGAKHDVWRYVRYRYPSV